MVDKNDKSVEKSILIAVFSTLANIIFIIFFCVSNHNLQYCNVLISKVHITKCI